MNRPYIKMCMAMTLDGKISSVDESGARFSSRADKKRLLSLRTETDAILVGAQTIRVDDDKMRVWTKSAQRERQEKGLPAQPICAIVSGSGSVPEDAAVFQDPSRRPLIFTTERMPTERREALRQRAHLHSVGETDVDFHAVLRVLSEQYEVNHVLAEGGGTLNFALFRGELVDELHLTLCPHILGGSDAPTIAEGEGFTLSEMRSFELVEVRQVEQELFLRYRRPTVTA